MFDMISPVALPGIRSECGDELPAAPTGAPQHDRRQARCDFT